MLYLALTSFVLLMHVPIGNDHWYISVLNTLCVGQWVLTGGFQGNAQALNNNLYYCIGLIVQRNGSLGYKFKCNRHKKIKNHLYELYFYEAYIFVLFY